LETNTVTCSMGTLAVGNSASVVIRVKARGQDGPITNTATFTSPQFDSSSGDNTATVQTTAVRAADLRVTKVDSADPIFVGGQTTYTMVVTNNIGWVTATGVVLTDNLPAGMTFVSATTSQGSLVTPPVGSTGIVTANLGSLAVGAKATVTVTVQATQAGVLSNTASVSGSESDQNTANNTVTQVTEVLTAMLSKVLLDSTTLVGGSNVCGSTNGTVYRTGPAPTGGTAVDLTVSSPLDQYASTTPTTVTVQPGNKTASFTVNTTAPPSQQSGLITATVPGTSVSRSLTVKKGTASCP